MPGQARAETISAFSSSKQVMDSLHGPNTLKQSRSIALSRLGYDIQVKRLDPLSHSHHLSNSQPSNLEKVWDFEKHLIFCLLR
jgi:hypothetical protein